ncbi:MAG: RecQ family ATP-dependent DNA helicase [Anaerolineae bacterium]
MGELPREPRGLLLAYLADWGPAALLLACADALIDGYPRLIVSSLDLRAQALLGLGRPEEAVATMRHRLERKDSFTGRLLLVRTLLAYGDGDGARQVAEAMTGEAPGTTIGWQALAEVELAAGNAETALIALRRLAEIVPQHRAYLMGMARAHALRLDWVAATSFAVALLEAAAEGYRVGIEELRQLRDLFRAAGEATRADDVDEELAGRLAADAEALRSALGDGPGPLEAEAAIATAQADAETALLASAATVPVSADERERIEAAAQALFGFAGLLPGQVETIACALRGESVLTILPTGGGKSLCFQLPAFLGPSGTTVVISPLIALMQDQWQHVPEPLRPRATFINSQLEGEELARRVAAAARGEYRLVYVAPERLRQPPVVQALRQGGVSRLVIDEAHCVSVWGHEFRPDYLALAEARTQLGQPPVLALTATAPERVRRDILRQLGDMRVVATDPRRANLTFAVMRTADLDAKYRTVANFCLAEPGSGIVYGGTRDRCEELAALLRRQGVNASHYHAGIEDRAHAQEQFMSGETRVMVATNAFGLGVDKPDVRFVLHFMPPDSLESYYQEAGRAGRDGLPARCLLLFTPAADKSTLTRHANQGDIPIVFLRSLYAAVRTRLRGRPCGRIAGADLLRDLATDDEVRLRVALGILEQAGLLRRGPDVPRSVTVALMDAGAQAEDPGLAAFRQTARLLPRQRLTLDPVETAEAAGLPPMQIEDMLLRWQEQGWAQYRASGRDYLLELPPAPEDASRRISDLLEILASVRKQRVSDMAAYAETRRCRHGYLNQYLGGTPIRRCDACDNCQPPRSVPDVLPAEGEQALAVLRCLADSRYGWGRANLTRILRGDGDAPEAAQSQESFGALGYRSPGGIESLIERLERAGLLAGRQLDHGGTVLLLSEAGAEALRDPGLLQRLFASTPR